jgi:divalent metal cation (Fe/Co/Zn/Cd) transporter
MHPIHHSSKFLSPLGRALVVKPSDPSAWLRRARLLAWFTVGYNLLEGFVSIAFGFSDDSVALWGFGLDSLIEVASALVVLWRLKAGLTARATERERKATLAIGILFLVLAGVVVGGSLLQLAQRHHPATTLPGLLIALASLSFMVWLWRAKGAAARALDSAALASDAACSLACIQLSGVLLAGSLVFWLLPGLWWADAVAACALALLIAKEGWSMVRAARSPGFGGGCGCH